MSSELHKNLVHFSSVQPCSKQHGGRPFRENEFGSVASLNMRCDDPEGGLALHIMNFHNLKLVRLESPMLQSFFIQILARSLPRSCPNLQVQEGR